MSIMAQMFPGTAAWMEAENKDGKKELPLSELLARVRADGRRCCQIAEELDAAGEDEARTMVRLIALHFLAGIMSGPLEAAPNYTVMEWDLGPMSLLVSAGKPGKRTLAMDYTQIYEHCTKAGWKPEDLSLADFVWNAVH